MSVKLKMPRVVQSKDTPLTHNQIMDVAPAVFNTHAGVNTLSQYQTIPTIDAITQLEARGYYPMYAAQARSQMRAMDNEAKHMIRMRHESHIGATNGSVPEVILVNAHDASSKFFIMLGLYRYVCANGLMAGTTVDTFKLRHVGSQLTAQLDDMLTQIADVSLPALMGQTKGMEARQLTAHEQSVFAARALLLRWPEGTGSMSTGDLLRVNRPEDAANDMWHTFNRVQENLLNGGQFTRRVQALEQVGSVINVNRALWDLAAA